METSFTSMLLSCFQVCIVVSEVTTIDGDVISHDGYSREISKGFIDVPLKDVLGAYQTEGKPYRNRNLPWGELMVVHKELAWSSLMFQHPLWASTTLKYLAQFNFGSTLFNVGVQWCGRLMPWLRSFGYKHSRSVPLALVTQINEFTQSVGLSTFAMMPCSTSASSSLLRGSRTASGRHLGGWMTVGTIGPRQTWNSPWKYQIPRKQSWSWEKSSDFASALTCGFGIGTVSVCVVRYHSWGWRASYHNRMGDSELLGLHCSLHGMHMICTVR